MEYSSMDKFCFSTLIQEFSEVIVLPVFTLKSNFSVSFDTDDLALVHILCGYIYIGMPILFIIGTCLSIPALLLYAHITARKDTQAPMSEVIFTASVYLNLKYRIWSKNFQ